jgi:hypothetical protein
MICYGFLTNGPRLQCSDFLHKAVPLTPCGLGSSQIMSQRLITKYATIPTQLSMTHSLQHT